MHKLKSVEVGSRVLVAMNGAVHELEVIEVVGENVQSKRLSLRWKIAHRLVKQPIPVVVSVKLPSGEPMRCQLFQAS